ncbi:DUF378 domain-containing protein [Lysinibacillus sp. CNPSo 3705]|uniref:DUF378 domain-containing protein n=1 Tax=Lysinibacillus sp. CNPSo 3705 TaxID=3028148 RepID=UPI002363D169|nr:DUF378 domain-containing protein [Lysinibacillus sp. CNPSo 3705]MDD1501942.1 DUF378 domain-containing protein [Lysinibacillus sp. CNPSo 3705]
MSVVYRIALVLVIVGAINWGLIGFFRFDLVAYLFGGQTAVLSRWIYAFVGIAGLISLPVLIMRFDEDEDLVPDLNHDHHTRIDRNPNYGMEFGDEADFTALKTTNVLKEEKKDSHSKNKKKNKK